MRAVVVPLDPSPAQEQLLRSYCGAARFAYNWTINLVQANLEVRSQEHNAGIGEENLTKCLSWTAWSMTQRWNSVKDDVAPWHFDVTKHAFRSGVTNACAALKNYDESKKEVRKGSSVGFPTFKNRRSKQSVTFIETRKQAGWFAEDSRHVRLVLPLHANDPRIARRHAQLQWLHTTESLSRLKKKVSSGEWTVQAVTICFTCGRWQASFSVRQYVDPHVLTHKLLGPIVGVDLGVMHLATLSVPVAGLSDRDGHVANSRPLESELNRLAKIDRQLARCILGSKNRAKLLRRRQRLYGRVTRTRELSLHCLSAMLTRNFGTVVLEDLSVQDMVRRSKGSNCRTRSRLVFDAGFYELRRQLTYKAADHGHSVAVVGRYFPSSKMCSLCGETKAKLALSERVFECSSCGITLDRDVNAARNIHREGQRLLANKGITVAGHQPETLNAVSRDHETKPRKWERRDRYQSRTTQQRRDVLPGASDVEEALATVSVDGPWLGS